MPLTLSIRQPVLDIRLENAVVDPQTLVVEAELVNAGDTVTNLTLDLLDEATGVPANFVIQPDIRHAYLQAGDRVQVRIIPLDVGSTTSPVSDPASLSSYVLTSNRRAIPAANSVFGSVTITARLDNGAAGVSANVTVSTEGGEVFNISNQCGYRGGNQTQPNACTMPAGQMEMNSSGWYCTNNPNFDVTIPWTLPAGVPILNASISAEFVRGGETVYNHGTELSLNNTQIGNATVPQQANPAFSVPSSAIIPGARSQSVNLRSLHTNDAHYTLTTNFTITVQHGAYESRQCFAPGVVNTSSLLAPACAPVYQGERERFIQQITTQCVPGENVVIDLNEDIVLEVNNSEGGLGPNGLPPITCNLTINGNNHAIDGNSTVRIFYVADGASLTLRDITLRNGRVGAAGGAAILALENSSLTIEDSQIVNNIATNADSPNIELQGGGIYAFQPTSVVVTQTSFRNNTVNSAGTNSQGGGLSVGGTNGTIVTLSNTYFESNTAATGAAFRMYSITGNTAKISLTNSCIGDHLGQQDSLSVQNDGSITGIVSQLWLADTATSSIGISDRVISVVGFTEQECIDPQLFPPRPDLSTYGVQIVYDGNFWNQSIQDQEVQNILQGVELIAEALEKLGVHGNTPQERFRSVFVESQQGGDDLTITVLRLPPNDQTIPSDTPYGFYYDRIAVNCLMNDVDDSINETPQGFVIACRGFQSTTLWNPQPPVDGTTGYGILTTEAFIHEMGHVIDSRYSGLEEALFSRPLYDCRPLNDGSEIMVQVISENDTGTFDLVRGDEGWGSAGAVLSQFQQNTRSTAVETSADMFLNWVYRITSDDAGYFDPSLVQSLGQDYLCGYKPRQANESNIPLSQLSPDNIQLAHDQDRTQWQTAASNWSGFQNIDGNGNFADNGVIVDGRQEYLPGNARYTRFHNQIQAILTQSELIGD